MMIKKISAKYQWMIVIILGFIITLVLYLSQVPASFLLGPMLAGIIVGLNRFDIYIPKSLFNLSQGILGCLTAKAITASVLMDLVSYWQLALVITISTIIISIAIGLFIVRFSNLPGSTAIWGIMPGGASAMVGICGDYGADPRLVALIQYLRVIFVILMLAVFSHFFAQETMTNNGNNAVWFATSKINLLYTILIAIIGVAIAKIIRFPSGRILLSMVIGTVLQINGIVQLETPLWLLLLCFGSIGLSVGLRFNIAVIKLAVRLLPIILLSIFMMLIFCYGQAILLHYYLGLDYLTCFLATSPGGLETSVVIALDTQSNLSIILPLQILRLFSVLVFGPIIARYLSTRFH
ncbi:AbrB family transcriptional regulator [Orbus mooreae]|uniref:AbrB family transcriptional regulator n=1 Tax=Orbus mooreae TaxID=3074107 RepID=UPI00370D2805